MRSLVAILFLFAIAVSCCNDDDEAPLVCGVEDPVNELAWLKVKVAELEASDLKEYFYVVQAELHGNTVFYVNNCCPFCNTIITYYNCEGLALEFATPNPADFKNQKIIWRPDNFSCPVM